MSKTMDQDDTCRIKWSEHRNNLVDVFEALFASEQLTDCTLVAENMQPLHVHKLMLSSCSDYFKNIFNECRDKNPIIIFNDVEYEELLCIIAYIYRGEAIIQQNRLNKMLEVAKKLKIKGLLDPSSKPASKQLQSFDDVLPRYSTYESQYIFDKSNITPCTDRTYSKPSIFSPREVTQKNIFRQSNTDIRKPLQSFDLTKISSIKKITKTAEFEAPQVSKRKILKSPEAVPKKVKSMIVKNKEPLSSSTPMQQKPKKQPASIRKSQEIKTVPKPQKTEYVQKSAPVPQDKPKQSYIQLQKMDYSTVLDKENTETPEIDDIPPDTYEIPDSPEFVKEDSPYEILGSDADTMIPDVEQPSAQNTEYQDDDINQDQDDNQDNEDTTEEIVYEGTTEEIVHEDTTEDVHEETNEEYNQDTQDETTEEPKKQTKKSKDPDESGKDDIKHACNCGRKFKHPHHLKHHLKYECGRTFQCYACPRTCKSKCNLNKHLALIHKIVVNKKKLFNI